MPSLARIQSVIARVPRGKVITYGQAAAAAGYLGAARLTVRALQRAEGLPWHRVVASGGRIALPGEEGREQRLRLEMEGIAFRAGRVRMDLHEWIPVRRLTRSVPRSATRVEGIRPPGRPSRVNRARDGSSAGDPRGQKEKGPGADEWIEWYRGYEGDGPLARRLRVVQQRIRETLDRLPPGSIQVLSLCAGDGRDLIGVLAEHPRAADVRARLVELDSRLADAGRKEAAALHLSGLTFLVRDASTTDACYGAVPADVVLVCGVFGNIRDSDVRNTIAHLRELLSPGATVIWTRGRFEPDLTPTIREWFRKAGFDELSFDKVPGTTASVGTHRLAKPPRRFRPGVRLFTFLPKAERPSQRPGRAQTEESVPVTRRLRPIRSPREGRARSQPKA